MSRTWLKLAVMVAPLSLPSILKAEEASASTLGIKAPEGAKVLFNGEDLKGWVKAGDKSTPDWTVEDGLMIVSPRKGAIMTEAGFGDFQLHIEFNIPYMPKAKGQARGNSGVYLAGIYELQVLDSYGLTLQNNDCGAIYKQIVPSVNACKPPLQWQTYDVTFHKARAEGDKVVKKARVTVVQNGIKIIDDAEIEMTPGGGSNKVGEDGPLLLQDHGNEVLFRNIWIKPLG
ncbi:3-keto-disaccharide hydrolase [Singulisphaera rosea]